MTSYQVIARLIFRGTVALGTPTNIKIITEVNGGGSPSGDIKIFDVTNSNTIVEKTGITTAPFAILDLGTLSNLPTGEAVIEIQMKKNTGSTNNIRMAALAVIF